MDGAVDFLFLSPPLHPPQLKHVGIWSDVIPYISWVALLTNAVIVCWTMNFIDRLVFEFKYKEEKSKDFFQFAFSEFATDNYKDTTRPKEVRVWRLFTC